MTEEMNAAQNPDHAQGHYGAGDIQVLEGLEAVRRRPGMYIGSTDYRGLHHCVYEIVDNAVDEALAGYCTDIIITIKHDGSVEVQDNGRGFPVGIHPKVGRPAVEVCLTMLHAGGKFGGEGYKVSGGLHGVGASVVNALSSHLMVTVYQGGKVYRQEYNRGKIEYDLKIIGDAGERTGTTVQFWPDIRSEQNPDGVFDPNIEFNYDILKTRMREMAFLNKGIKIVLRDEREGREQERVFHYEGGIREFVKFLNKNREVLFPEPIYIEGVKNGVSVEAALQYNDSYAENIYTFANNIHTPEGGTHLMGFQAALTRVINDYGRNKCRPPVLKDADANLKGEDVRESLTAIVSVKMHEPQFEGQTKSKLGNSEVRPIVDAMVAEGLSTYLEENPAVARMAVETGLVDVLMFSINPAYDLQPASENVDALWADESYARTLHNVDPERERLYELCERTGVGIDVMKVYGGGDLLSVANSPFGRALTPVQCIEYALTRPAVAAVMVGCKSRAEIEAALAWCGAPAAERDYTAVMTGLERFSWRGHCMYCGHCAPCSAGIDIAAVNKFRNLAQVQGEIPETVREHYRTLAHHASECIGCGLCEPRCPFGVEIVEAMRRAAERFGY